MYHKILSAFGALLLTLAMLSPAPAQAQGHKNLRNQMATRLFPPQLLLKHADALALTKAQKTQLRTLKKKLQADVQGLRFDMREESHKLTMMLDKPGTPEAKILAQVDKVMALEAKVKRKHVQMMLQVRKVLQPKQLAIVKAQAQKKRKRQIEKKKRRLQRQLKELEGL